MMMILQFYNTTWTVARAIRNNPCLGWFAFMWCYGFIGNQIARMGTNLFESSWRSSHNWIFLAYQVHVFNINQHICTLVNPIISMCGHIFYLCLLRCASCSRNDIYHHSYCLDYAKTNAHFPSSSHCNVSSIIVATTTNWKNTL